MAVDGKYRYRTPGPGAYDVRKASRQCLKSAPIIAFGGALNRVDREKTGPLKVLGEKQFVPGPCSYAVEAEEQARDLCERPHGLIFGRAKRDDLAKLFLGKDAVAYVTRTSPGPGTYELGYQRPVFKFLSHEPGPLIGGPLANVDRVQTGPLGEAYRSDTPGPGAYHETDVRTASTRRRPGRDEFFSRAGSTSTSSWSGTEFGRASTEGCKRPITGRGEEGDEGRSQFYPGARSCHGEEADGPFSLSPFRFVDNQGHDSWQLPLLGPRRPASTPSRRKPRASQSGRLAKGPKAKDQGKIGSASSLSAGYSQASWQSPSLASRPVTTFGMGSREQAGQVLAPGFKGCAPRSTIGNPGPGAYRHVPGSLGPQVNSTLHTSTASSFRQSARMQSFRDAGVPGPGSYVAVSSLGHQVSSTCTTAPHPKFGTSVRCSLEDGLVG